MSHNYSTCYIELLNNATINGIRKPHANFENNYH